jgi:hypothetical protein
MRKTLHKNSQYNQGIFSPLHPEKYKGSLPIIFRSSLELKVYRWMDNNSNILSWGSESVIIPYISPLDNRMHRYFVDLVAHLRDKSNAIKKILVEIKPFKQTQKPTISNRKSKKTIIYEHTQYAVNLAKWDAAKKWCDKNGYIFLTLTEKHINSQV